MQKEVQELAQVEPPILIIVEEGEEARDVLPEKPHALFLPSAEAVARVSRDHRHRPEFTQAPQKLVHTHVAIAVCVHRTEQVSWLLPHGHLTFEFHT